MAYANLSKELVEEIRAMRKDLDYIKAHMVDVDSILTPEEEARLDKSLEEHKKVKAFAWKTSKKVYRECSQFSLAPKPIVFLENLRRS